VPLGTDSSKVQGTVKGARPALRASPSDPRQVVITHEPSRWQHIAEPARRQQLAPAGRESAAEVTGSRKATMKRSRRSGANLLIVRPRAYLRQEAPSTKLIGRRAT